MKSPYLVILSLLACICTALSPNGSTIIKVGLLLYYIDGVYDWSDAIESIYLRIDQMNRENTSLIHPDAKIVPTLLNNHGQTKELIIDTLQMTQLEEIFIIGTGGSSKSIIASLILQNYNIPMCCGASTNPTLARKDLYPNFFRTIPNDNDATLSLAEYIVSNGWFKIATLNSDDDYGNGEISTFLTFAEQMNITILSRQIFETNIDYNGAVSIAKQILSSQARIVIYFGNALQYQTIVDASTKVGVYGEGFVWIGTDGLNGMVPTPSIAGTTFLFPLERDDGPVADQFDAYWKQNRLNVLNPAANLSQVNSTSSFGYFFSSCVDLMALGMDALVKANGNNVTKLALGELNSQMKVPSAFQFPDFETTTGKVVLDQNGERKGDYGIYNFQADLSFPMVSKWSNGREIQYMPYVYPGGTLVKPADAIDPTTVADYLRIVGDPLGITTVCIGILGFLMSIATIALTVVNRGKSIIKSSDINSGLVMQLCILVSWLNFGLMVNIPSKSMCTSDSFLLPITFSIYYGMMFIKNYRLYVLFTKIYQRKMFSNHMTIAVGVGISIPIIVLSLIWNFVDAPKPAVLSEGSGLYAWSCSSSSVSFQATMVSVISVYCAALLLLNLFIAFKTRNIPSKFNETKMISVSIYNSVLICLFAIATLSAPGINYRLKAAIKIIAVFCVLFFNLLSSFTYKVYLCWLDDEKGTSKGSASSKTGGSVNNDGVKKKSRDKSKVLDDAVVLMKKVGFWSEAKSRVIVAETPELVTFCNYQKLRLEDKEGVAFGAGIVWKLKGIKVFRTESLSKNHRKYIVDGDSFTITYLDTETASAWDSYFLIWTRTKNNASIATTSLKSTEN